MIPHRLHQRPLMNYALLLLPFRQECGGSYGHQVCRDGKFVRWKATEDKSCKCEDSSLSLPLSCLPAARVGRSPGTGDERTWKARTSDPDQRQDTGNLKTTKQTRCTSEGQGTRSLELRTDRETNSSSHQCIHTCGITQNKMFQGRTSLGFPSRSL